MTPALQRTHGRSLVAGRLFELLVDDVAMNHPVDREFATRVVDQALAFLATVGRRLRQPRPDDEPLRPSGPVDWGWHAFLLRTRPYAAFCADRAGQFIHHTADDGMSCHRVRSHEATLTAMAAAGFVVDNDLWAGAHAANCSQDGCSASGRGGDENTEHRPPPPVR